jgi:hypothetical protein
MMSQIPESRAVSIASGMFMLVSLPLLPLVLASFIHLATNIALLVGSFCGVVTLFQRLEGCSKVLVICFWPHFLLLGSVTLGAIGFTQSLKTSLRIFIVYYMLMKLMLSGPQLPEL